MSTQEEHAAPETPNYVLIWGILVSALLVSLFLGYMDLPVVAAVLIFTIAIAKAWLVVAYYMHLKFEPYFVLVIMGAGLACLYFLFVGLVPDIVFGTDWSAEP